MKRAVAPLRAPEHGREPAAWHEAPRCLYSIGGWLVAMPVVLLHEAAHVFVSLALGYGFMGAGYRYEYRGHIWRVPLYRIEAFFMAHRPASGLEGYAISLAPALWAAPGYAVADSRPLLAVFFALAAATVFSDVMEIFASELFDLDERPGRWAFVVGGPDQWQTTLAEYE